MNHNDIVRQSFKKQAEKFVAYHMSKVEYTDYLIQKIAATGEEHAFICRIIPGQRMIIFRDRSSSS